VKKLITLIIALLLLLIGCSNAEKRGEPDFENSRWGDSMETVFKNENGGLWRLLAKEYEFAGLSATSFLYFNEQELLCGGSNWGDSREQVYANENGGLWQLQVTTEFAGFEVPAYFVFQEEKNLLQLAYYDLTEGVSFGRATPQKMK